MQILKETDELFVCPVLNWLDQDTVAVALVEDKYIFISPVVCDWELDGEVGCYPLLGIDYIGEDVVGVCIKYFHWFIFGWGCILSLGGLDVLPALIHVSFCSCHRRR